MNTAAFTRDSSERVAEGGFLSTINEYFIFTLFELCNEFRDWEHQKIILGSPDAATLAEHKKALRHLSKYARMIHDQLTDPASPGRSLARELDIRISQLEDSYKLIHEPLPAAEAEELLARYFPNES